MGLVEDGTRNRVLYLLKIWSILNYLKIVFQEFVPVDTHVM